MLLDTNVVSEVIRRSPAPAVAAWVSDHLLEDLFFSAIGEAELCYGAATLPAGRLRATLFFKIDSMPRDAFEGRVLPFDAGAAGVYGSLAALRRAG